MRPCLCNSLTAIAAALAVTACAGVAPRQETGAAAAGGATIVALERQFAAAARERGVRSAFLEFLAEDSIVLQPGPVWGRAAYESQPEFAGTLEWVPDQAEMSAAGDLGFSTGPWVLTPQGDGRILEGRYLSAWQRQADGWRVVFDGGIARLPDGAPHPLDVEAVIDRAGCEKGPAILPGELQLHDLAMSGSEAGPSHAERVLAIAGAGFMAFDPPRVERAGDPADVAARVAQRPSTTQLWPMGARVAASGDLGYSYGLSAAAADAAADSTYTHVWCHTAEGWRLLVQMRTALPPRPAKGN